MENEPETDSADGLETPLSRAERILDSVKTNLVNLLLDESKLEELAKSGTEGASAADSKIPVEPERNDGGLPPRARFFGLFPDKS